MTQETRWINFWRDRETGTIKPGYASKEEAESVARPFSGHRSFGEYLGPVEAPVPKQKVKKKITRWTWAHPNGDSKGIYLKREYAMDFSPGSEYELVELTGEYEAEE